MKIRLQAINIELWQIVEGGYTVRHPDALSSNDEVMIQLDAQAKDIISDCISRDIFIWFRKLDTAK